jgi:hypothetical protein
MLIAPCTEVFELVVDRGSRAREVVDLVDLRVERKGDVVAQELEQRIAEQVEHVGLAPGVEVVDADHLVAARQQAPAQMRSDESRAAGNQYSLALRHAAFQSIR